MSRKQINYSVDAEQHDGQQERGSALVMAVFVLALLTAMGAALMFLSQTEVTMSRASLKPKQAFFLAEAGLEQARQALWFVNRAQDFDDDLLTASGGAGDAIDFSPDSIAPVFDSNGNVTGFTGYGNDTPLVATQTLDGGWYAAFMTNDLGEGRANEVDTDNRVIIAGVGVGPDQSFEVVEAVIDIDPFLPQMPPATIFLLGPTPAFSSATSKVKDYSGEDCGVAGGDYYPIVGTIGSAAEADAEAGVNPNPDWYSNGGQPADDTISDMTASPVDSMSDPTFALDSEWQDCDAVKAMVLGMRAAADVICPAGSSLAGCPGIPANSPRRLIFVDGDFSVGPGGPEFGVLVVTGQLVMSGNASWTGLILVVGEGSFRMNGAGNGEVIGGMIVANIDGSDNVFPTGDDCTSGFGASVYDERGGGNAGTTYCSTALNITEQAWPYDILEFRQH